MQPLDRSIACDDTERHAFALHVLLTVRPSATVSG
jgi:hypothetical protein